MDTRTEESDLHIWHGERRADLAPVKAAKLALNIERKVWPVDVRSLADLPSLDSRVLAIGSRPTFICDYALTSERTSPAGWERALSWVLGVTEHDDKATTIEDVMVSIFGPGTRELSEAELESERKMAAYINGED